MVWMITKKKTWVWVLRQCASARAWTAPGWLRPFQRSPRLLHHMSALKVGHSDNDNNKKTKNLTKTKTVLLNHTSNSPWAPQRLATKITTFFTKIKTKTVSTPPTPQESLKGWGQRNDNNRNLTKTKTVAVPPTPPWVPRLGTTTTTFLTKTKREASSPALHWRLGGCWGPWLRSSSHRSARSFLPGQFKLPDIDWLVSKQVMLC